MMKYFMTHLPKAGRFSTASGKVFTFETLDHTRGFLASDDSELITDLQKHIKGERFGIEEIDEATYQAQFVQKKTGSGTPPPPWREEISAGTYAQDTISPPAATPLPSPQSVVVAPAATEEPAKTTEFKPKTARKSTVK